MSLAVVGTDTEVGKTVASALVCQRYRQRGPAYWKPVASGASPGPSDSEEVRRLCGADVRILESAYAFQAPESPHYAARLESRRIDREGLTNRYRELSRGGATLVMEGIGGVLVPLTEDLLLADWLSELRIPCLVVARSSLGTLNHTLLTLEALRARNLDVAGLVLNGPHHEENQRLLGLRAPFIGRIETLSPLDTDSLSAAAESFDRSGQLEPYLSGPT